MFIMAVVAVDPPNPPAQDPDAPRLVRPTAPQPIPRPAADRSVDDTRQAAIVRAARGPDGRLTQILGLPRELRPIEERVADRNVLSMSTRIVRSDPTAAPIGFENLYEAPDESGKLVRGDGGLYATFPYSVYRRTKKGILIETPPGTLFHIGMPLAWRAAPPPPLTYDDPRPGQMVTRVATSAVAPRAGRIDLRVDLFRGDLLSAEQPPTPTAMRPVATNAPKARPKDDVPTSATSQSLPRFFSDESYRRALLASLRREARPAAAPSHPATSTDGAHPSSAGE